MRVLIQAALAVLPVLPAVAQPVAGAAPAFRSAFDHYQSFKEAEVAPWKESNETVGRIGGWRAYAREAQGAPTGSPGRAAASAAPAATSAAPSATGATPAPGAHKH